MCERDNPTDNGHALVFSRSRPQLPEYVSGKDQEHVGRPGLRGGHLLDERVTRFVHALQLLHEATPLLGGEGGVNAQEVPELVPARLFVYVRNLERKQWNGFTSKPGKAQSRSLLSPAFRHSLCLFCPFPL